MKLTQEEVRILKDLAEVSTNIRPGRKAANYEQTREARRAEWKKVGDLINRYEQWLKQN
jgi:hypothetical protein